MFINRHRLISDDNSRTNTDVEIVPYNYRSAVQQINMHSRISLLPANRLSGTTNQGVFYLSLTIQLVVSKSCMTDGQRSKLAAKREMKSRRQEMFPAAVLQENFQ